MAALSSPKPVLVLDLKPDSARKTRPNGPLAPAALLAHNRSY